MENKDDLSGKIVRLPDGQRVLIETVHSDGYVSVRRIEGERKETIAICKVSKLLRMMSQQQSSGAPPLFSFVDFYFRLE